MEVWKIIFFPEWVISRFYGIFSGVFRMKSLASTGKLLRGVCSRHAQTLVKQWVNKKSLLYSIRFSKGPN